MTFETAVYKYSKNSPNSALADRFLSSTVNEKDLAKLYDIATQGYFHDMRDKLQKRHRR
uniref:Uncharacterized protein n=1 Tax=Schistosoma haematobium TaxID=6185 RepID=A0A095AES7_SCHHA